MLNNDQKKGLEKIKNWWRRKELYFILEGNGGTGKSFLINEVLKTLKDCNPLLLAPTNEAVKQIREKVEGDFIFKTVHSALGIAPTVNEYELKFEHIALPSFLDDINLIILDEASMINEDILKLLISLKIKILFIGHKSQLPPVKVRRKIDDLCISPVFEKDFETFSLTQPMRNLGELWNFNNLVEKTIYSKEFPADIEGFSNFLINEKKLKERIKSLEWKDKFFENDLKFVLWSNDGVDRYNQRIRENLHGDLAKKYKYLPNDLIILTKPTTVIESLEKYNDLGLKKVYKNNNLETLYSNTKMKVKACVITTVSLNKNLSFPCYKIFVEIEEENYVLYNLVSSNDKEIIGKFYDHQAWAERNQKNKEILFKQKHFILSCFSEVKHYFAVTSHRLQGATINDIVVIYNNIMKNPCMVEKKKCFYVATSRAKDNLLIYKGL